MQSDTPILELMLHVATARGILGWASWREAFESVIQGDSTCGLTPDQGTRILDNLGHVELVSVDGALKIAAAPAVLTRLPRLGLPTAILCGGRSPQTERKLREAAAGNSARMVIAPSYAERHMPPRSFFVECEDVAHLRIVAEKANVAFEETPASWLLAHSAGNLDAYLASLTWRNEPPPNLPASDFLPDLMLFSSARSNRSSWRLTRYFPRKLPSYFSLRNGEAAARSDRDWGIYAVLNAHGRNCLVYDSKCKMVAVPAAAPLPKLFGRAFCLCSGLAPAWLPQSQTNWKLPELRGYLVYTGVPQTIAEILFSKLGQSPIPLHVPVEFFRTINSHRAL